MLNRQVHKPRNLPKPHRRLTRLDDSIPQIEAHPCNDLIAIIKAGGWLVPSEVVPANSGDSYNRFIKRNSYVCLSYEELVAADTRKDEARAVQGQIVWEELQRQAEVARRAKEHRLIEQRFAEQQRANAVRNQRWLDEQHAKEDARNPEEAERRNVLRRWPAMFANDPVLWVTILDVPCHIAGAEFVVNFTPRQHYVVPKQIADILIAGNRAVLRPTPEQP